jgi:hypothetical protein
MMMSEPSSPRHRRRGFDVGSKRARAKLVAALKDKAAAGDVQAIEALLRVNMAAQENAPG